MYGIWRCDEYQVMDLSPVINDWEEFLLQQDFLFVGIEPMDAERRTRVVSGLHFRRAAVPCGDDYGDAVLWQRLALGPRFALLVGIAMADGEFVSSMSAECSDGE